MIIKVLQKSFEGNLRYEVFCKMGQINSARTSLVGRIFLYLNGYKSDFLEILKLLKVCLFVPIAGNSMTCAA